MANKFTVKINDKAVGELKVGSKQIKNLRKPMAQFLNYLELQTKQQFVTETDPEGKPWADLKAETWARKNSDSILRERSIMINTIYTKVTKQGGEIGLTSEYAWFHQIGTENMEQREILGITEERLENGAAIFEAYVGEQLGAE